MESDSKISDCTELLKNKINNLSSPLKNNITRINETVELFEKMTSTLLNPIKKLKISYNMRINSFKGKYESALLNIRNKMSAIEKGNLKENKQLSNQILEEFTFQNKEISKEHSKLMRLLEDCLGNISSLNNLFDTEEFKKIDEMTKNLNLNKKKTKVPTLNLNEDDSPEIENNENDEDNINKIRKLKNSQKIKNKNSKTNEKRKINNNKIKNNGNFKEFIDLNGKSIENEESSNLNSSKGIKKSLNMIGNGNHSNKNGTLNENENENENEEKEEKEEDSNEEKDSTIRKLTDEECLEKMKENFDISKGLTKTFITRKLRKRIMIKRLIDYNDESTYLNIENTIPKKSGLNNSIKATFEICDKEEYKIDSNLLNFLRNLFNIHYIFFKKIEGKFKFLIAGQITKDISYFLRNITTDEFKNKFSVQSAKIKAYAFYEELICELENKSDREIKTINEEDISNYMKQYDHLQKMRKIYEEIRTIRVPIE